MRTLTAHIAALATALSLLCCGCNRNSNDAPVPLPENQISAALSKAFANADKDVQDQINEYIKDVVSHDYAAAFEAMQMLVRRAGLTDDQRAILARASMTTSQKLQEAAASGDNRANEVLSSYAGSK